jgi:hypothetical protein
LISWRWFYYDNFKKKVQRALKRFFFPLRTSIVKNWHPKKDFILIAIKSIDRALSRVISEFFFKKNHAFMDLIIILIWISKAFDLCIRKRWVILLLKFPMNMQSIVLSLILRVFSFYEGIITLARYPYTLFYLLDGLSPFHNSNGVLFILFLDIW